MRKEEKNRTLVFANRFYYITLSTRKNIPLFNETWVCDLFLHILMYNKYALDYKVHGFVILPDQVHLILYSPQVPVAQAIKKNTANFTRYYQKISGQSQFTPWDPDFTMVPIENADFYKKVRAYVHHTPVRKNLVATAGSFHYSSYRFYEGERADFMLLLDAFSDEACSP